MSDKSRGTFQILSIAFFLIFLLGVLGSMFFFAWKIFSLPGQLDGNAGANPVVKSDPKHVRIQREYADDDFIYRLSLDSISRDSVNSADSVFRIEILSKVSRKKIQEINPGPNSEFSSTDQSLYPRFVIGDLNTDGANDFKLLTEMDSTKKQNFARWFYDPASKNFKADSLNQKIK